MSLEQQQTVASEVFAAMESGTLTLPTLPDMAMKLRSMIDDPNVSAEAVIRLLSTDPVISAQIIRTANSAAFARGNPVHDLRTAVSRLGYRMLHNMVMLISMSKLFKVDSPFIHRQLIHLWEHSREVAANSYVLALHQKHLKPEQAMLAGLVHDLGALPLCIYADHHHPQLDEETLEGLIRKFHTEVGSRLLTNWHFPADMVEVVAQHENLQRMTPDNKADYIDVVTVANLLMPTTAKFVAWENVRATDRLGYKPTQCQNFLATYAEQLSAVHEMLGITSAQSQSPKTAPPTSAVTERPSVPSPKEKPDSATGVLSGLFNIFK